MTDTKTRQLVFSLAIAFGIASCVLMAVSLPAQAQENSDGSLNVVYRNASGIWTDESQRTAKRLARKARRNGNVTLWLTLNYPFQTTVEQMTEKERRKQEQQVTQKLRKLLVPLLSSGDVSFPSGRLEVVANGCKIVTTAAGIRSLVSDERVLHLVETIS